MAMAELKPKPKKFKYDYGIVSEIQLSQLEVLLHAFRLNPAPEVGGQGKPFYFWKIVELMWGEKSGSSRRFVPHPWAERMVELACQYDYLAIHGAGSTGKTDFAAIWAIVNWLCDPPNTLVLLTSTSLKESRLRLWGSIAAYFQAVEWLRNSGRLVDSLGLIKTIDADGNCANAKSGIVLIPGEKKKEREAIGKIIGMKNQRVFLIADELPELSEALISAAMSNLTLNPYFQMIGLGNFASVYDPLGVFACPKAGWGSVTVDDEEWETKDGYCLHLDGMKSPNVIAGRKIYPIYGPEDLKRHKKELGDNSALFWRMCRSFPCPEGEIHTMYSDADFIRGDASSPARWLTEPVPVCAADPAFSNDGDTFSAAFGYFGRNYMGMPTLAITDMRTYIEDVNLTKKGEARDLQTARRFAMDAQIHGVTRNNIGVDCSGPGGIAFGSIFSIFWHTGFLSVKFGEEASNMVISEEDSRKGHEAFVNLASEIWFTGRSFVRAGQIKGISTDVAKQLKARTYETVKRGDFVKVQIEPKQKMKSRTGGSPDEAESVLILLYLCRTNFGFMPNLISGFPGSRTVKPNSDWISRARKAHTLYNPNYQFSK